MSDGQNIQNQGAADNHKKATTPPSPIEQEEPKLPTSVNSPAKLPDDELHNQKSAASTNKKVAVPSTPTPTRPEIPQPSAHVDSSIKESEDMEVHHHPHLHHKKNWTAYLFEFFMLFLAVVLGFMFENLREHYIEHQRAKKYAQSLYNDLKKDAESINNLTSYKRWRSKKLDSLLIVTSPSAIETNVLDAYYYNCYLVIPDLPFRPSDITIQQLRNSGNLRYFSLPLINRITQYYNNCNFYAERETEHRQMIPPYSLTSKIFDADLHASIFPSTPQPDLKDILIKPDLTKEFKLLSSYKQTLNEYRLYVGKQKRGNDGMIMLLHSLVQKPQKELIEELQKEYPVH